MTQLRPPEEGFAIDLGEVQDNQLRWHQMPIPAIQPRDLKRLAGDVVDIVMNSAAIAYIRVRKVHNNNNG
jgi:hypothetical protein